VKKTTKEQEINERYREITDETADKRDPQIEKEPQ